MLLFETSDGRWRISSTPAGNGFVLEERWPDRGLYVWLEDVSLVEVGEFLAEQGVKPGELRRA